MRAQIAGLVGELCAAGVEPAVDSRRVLLCGTSMGGDGVWTLAAARPELFAACVPVCAAANLAAVAHLDHKPTWIFHAIVDAIDEDATPAQDCRLAVRLVLSCTPPP